MAELTQAVEAFIVKLKRGKVSGSYNCALETLSICRLVVQQSRWKHVRELTAQLRYYGEKMAEAKPSELAIENIVRRVLYIVREEHASRQAEHEHQQEKQLEKIDLKQSMNMKLKRSVSALHMSINMPAMVRMLEDNVDESEQTLSEDEASFRNSIISELNDLETEIRDLYINVTEQANDHIHSNEIIMTYGRARTVEQFLQAVAHKRKFQLIVAEAAPGYSGRELAKNMGESGQDTILIPDSAIGAMMARVNKVIIGTHAVMANGGLIASVGTRLLAEAAKVHSVPVIVCTGLYKLSPRFPSDLDVFQDLQSPSEIIPFADELPGVTVENPAWDYVPPELVSLFITNSGGHNPSYIYRLLAEYYNPTDKDLFEV